MIVIYYFFIYLLYISYIMCTSVYLLLSDITCFNISMFSLLLIKMVCKIGTDLYSIVPYYVLDV